MSRLLQRTSPRLCPCRPRSAAGGWSAESVERVCRLKLDRVVGVRAELGFPLSVSPADPTPSAEGAESLRSSEQSELAWRHGRGEEHTHHGLCVARMRWL